MNMKKKILTLLVLLMTAVTGAWATDSHWPDFIPSDYEGSKVLVAGITIDGEIITAEYDGWNQLEVAAFVGNECRSAGADVNFLYNGYVQEYGDPFPILDGMTIFYNGEGGETLTFKMYNHATGVEYTACAVTYQGDPITIETGEEHTEGWDDPENPIFLNFTTPEPAGPESIDLTTTDNLTWTLASMPGYDVELEVEYFPLATLATLPAAAEGVVEGTDAALLTPGTSAEGTLAYAIGTSEAPTGQWSDAIPTAQDLEAGTCYVWYKVVGDAEHSDSQPQSIAVTIAEAPAYAVTIDDAGVDASNWQATPAEPKTGQTVTLSYGGKKKIRSITIEKAATAPAAPALLQVTVHESSSSPGVGDHIINYESGETWAEAIANHPTENVGWSIKSEDDLDFVFYGENQVWYRDSGSGVFSVDPIDANDYYEF